MGTDIKLNYLGWRAKDVSVKRHHHQYRPPRQPLPALLRRPARQGPLLRHHHHAQRRRHRHRFRLDPGPPAPEPPGCLAAATAASSTRPAAGSRIISRATTRL